MGTVLTVAAVFKRLGFVVLDASGFFRVNCAFTGIIVLDAIGLVADRGIASLNCRLVH